MIRPTPRTFISPQNAAEEGLSMADVLNAFGIQNTPPADPPPADPDPAIPSEPPLDPPAKPPEEPPVQKSPEEPPDPKPPQEPPSQEPPKTGKGDQAAQAFAAMRIQNKEYQKIIQGIAGVLGVKDTSDPDVITKELNDLITKAAAKNSGVPEEVYKRLQTLEERDREFTKKELHDAAYIGFQAVKDTYQLTNEQLNAFAEELVTAGLNPFENKIDVLKEYRVLHLEDLLKTAETRGAQAEAARAAKAHQHSTVPNQKGGPGGSDPEKITSIDSLDAWLNKQKSN